MSPNQVSPSDLIDYIKRNNIIDLSDSIVREEALEQCIQQWCNVELGIHNGRLSFVSTTIPHQMLKCLCGWITS